MIIAVSKLHCGNAVSMPHLRHTGTVDHDVWIMLIKATWFVKNLIHPSLLLLVSENQ